MSELHSGLDHDTKTAFQTFCDDNLYRWGPQLLKQLDEAATTAKVVPSTFKYNELNFLSKWHMSEPPIGLVVTKITIAFLEGLTHKVSQ
jgi:hypothetical protein